MAKRACFVVNPLAGIGGPLALKGSDGEAGREALRRGARLVAPERARRFTAQLARLLAGSGVELLTAGGVMGADYLRGAGLGYEVVYEPRGWPTRREDTVATVKECLRRGAELVVFVGGDGTARDVVAAGAGSEETPVLGVPAGVKMYSSVFAETPEAAAEVVADWARGRASPCSGEVLDIDEEAFRRGRLSVRLYAVAYTLCHPLMVGSSKQPSPETSEERENRGAIARYIAENMEDCTLYILGPGSTVKAIADALGVEKTLLGVDAVHNRRLVGKDLDEESLYRLIAEHRRRGGRVRIIVTPIGGQGFILGRGNQQLSPRVIREAGGKEAIIVIATHGKLRGLRRLRVDTGDSGLDSELAGYLRVVTDYGEETLVPVEAYTEASKQDTGI